VRSRASSARYGEGRVRGKRSARPGLGTLLE